MKCTIVRRMAPCFAIMVGVVLLPTEAEADFCCQFPDGCVSVPPGTPGVAPDCESFEGLANPMEACRSGLCVTEDGSDGRHVCVGELPEGACCVLTRDMADECAGPSIPIVSEWGIMTMTLLLLTAMTIKFGQRQRVTR